MMKMQYSLNLQIFVTSNKLKHVDILGLSNLSIWQTPNPEVPVRTEKPSRFLRDRPCGFGRCYNSTLAHETLASQHQSSGEQTTNRNPQPWHLLPRLFVRARIHSPVWGHCAQRSPRVSYEDIIRFLPTAPTLATTRLAIRCSGITRLAYKE